MKKIALLLLLVLGVAGAVIFDHPKSSPTPVRPMESPVASAPHDAILRQTGPASFDDRLKVALKTLPTLNQLRALTNEEAHESPALIEKASDILAEIATAIHDNPELIPQATGFYQTCAQRDDLPSSVRALCFSDYRELAKQDLDVPEPVRQLADKLATPE